jgi:hypothetical protein
VTDRIENQFRRDVERFSSQVSESLAAIADVLGWSKAITVESPTASERIPLGFVDTQTTMTRMVAVVSGIGGPSVTWTIRFGADASGVGTELVTGGTTTTSTTTGSDVIALTVTNIPAERFLWLETTAQSGTVATLAVTIFGYPVT